MESYPNQHHRFQTHSESGAAQAEMPVELPLAQRLVSEAGAANFGEIAAAVVDEAAISYYGLRARMAERREERARERTERLQHKAVLYEHLGSVAMGQASTVTEADGSTPQAKSWAERFMDRRAEKRDFKQDIQQIKRERTVKIYGGTQAEVTRFDSSADTFIRNQVANAAYRRGELTASELRTRKAQISGSINTYENSEQRKSRRKLEKADKRLDRATRQPVASRWRSFRQTRAEEAARRHAGRRVDFYLRQHEARDRRG